MKDEGLLPTPGLGKAEQAVRYLLQRIQYDADLRWHMINTEAYRLLCVAEAERTGKTEEFISSQYLMPRNEDRPKLVAARRAIRAALTRCREHLLHTTVWGQQMMRDLERHAE